MAIDVITQEITDVPAPIAFGPIYNNVDATVFVPDGADSIFIGGPDVDDADEGIEWLPGSEHDVKIASGEKLYAVASTGITVTIKILPTGL